MSVSVQTDTKKNERGISVNQTANLEPSSPLHLRVVPAEEEDGTSDGVPRQFDNNLSEHEDL